MSTLAAIPAPFEFEDEPEHVDLVTELGLEDLPPVMSPKILGDHIEVSATTLKRWRDTWPAGDRLGPAFTTPPGANMIRYTRKDVATWLASSRAEEVR